MAANPELLAIIFQQVQTTKDLAEHLQEKIVKAKGTNVTIPIEAAQAIATVLRVDANMIAGFIEENQTMLDRINDLVDRLHNKKE